MGGLGLACLALAGCGSEPEPEAIPPRLVYTVEASEPRDSVERFFSGQLRTAEGVSLAFEVSGRVVEVVAKQGQEYAAGDVLARLDVSDYENSLENARAGLTQSEQDLRRVQRLFESGNASQSQLDGAIAAERSARANFNQATKRLEDTTLRMPYQGTIASVAIDAQQVVSTGQAVMSIQGEGPMEFVFGVPTGIVGKLAPGMPLTVELGDVEGRSFGGRVAEVSPDLENNTTYGIIAAMNTVEGVFRAGMDGEARIELPVENGGSIEIPIGSVIADPAGGHYLWIAESSGDGLAKVVKRTVSIGMLSGEGVVSIESGLSSGERVISRGVHRVEEGMTVVLQN